MTINSDELDISLSQLHYSGAAMEFADCDRA